MNEFHSDFQKSSVYGANDLLGPLAMAPEDMHMLMIK